MNNVTFQYKHQKNILSNINLHIKEGEVILICGESGCGKTTLTKLINGLIPHFEEEGNLNGQVFVNNLSVPETEMHKLAESIGSVFQNPKSQFFHLDSNSEIVFGLENLGVKPEKIRERMEQTVYNLDINHLMNRNIFSMSGGEKQLLAFASVYAMNPKVFILDEPTANLDSKAIQQLRKQIMKIKAEGKTVVIAEHRLYFLMDLIDRAIILSKGKIYKSLSQEEFQKLSEDKRIKLGLRSFCLPPLNLPYLKDTSSDNGLSIKNLTCTYGRNIVFENVNFSVKRGQILGIVGYNGSGKTTLVRCLCGLVKEKRGQVMLHGKRLTKKERNKRSFLVMQDVNHQLFTDSVWNECESSKTNKSNQEITKVLKDFDLFLYKECHPISLSGGQKQRLAIATSYLSDKEILIFDEPTSGLDFKRMMEVHRMIRSLAKDNKIILIISHDVEFLNITCDALLNMEKFKTKRS